MLDPSGAVDGDHVKAAGNVLVSPLRQEPFGDPEDPVLLPAVHVELSFAVGVVIAVFDFHKDKIVLIPGDQIDLTERAAVIPRKHRHMMRIQIRGSKVFIPATGRTFVFQFSTVLSG